MSQTEPEGGDCGLWTISLLFWALDDHSKWVRGKLLNLGACSKDRWTLGRGLIPTG